MSEYVFTITVGGAIASDQEGQFLDRVYEAGCDDGVVGFNEGTPFIEFMREADSAEEAITSAIANIEAAGYQAQYLEESGLMLLADIAHRVEIKSTTLHNFKTGLRGPGKFPKAVSGLDSKSQLYPYQDVVRWLNDAGKIDSPELVEVADAAAKLAGLFEFGLIRKSA